MNVSLFQAAAALNATNRWQEAIAENLACGSVPGFKKQETSFAAVEAGLMNPAQGVSGPRFTLPGARAATNFSSGELQVTGGPTDLALEGAGFFEVQLPSGELAYTRDGEFRVALDGRLTAKNGSAVMGEAGPIQVDPRNPHPLAVSASGEISQGAEALGKLRVVQFADPQLLTPTGGGYYLARNPGAQPAPVAEPLLRQGFLENANTIPMVEMGNLLTAMRFYEANQRVVSLQDERLGRVIGELGSPT